LLQNSKTWWTLHHHHMLRDRFESRWRSWK
jgi:hypothetical protein